VRGADQVKLGEAAAYLGVATTTLAERVDAGEVPEAIRQHGQWLLPLGSLGAVAERHGWLLDLTDRRREPTTALLHHDPIDALAAHAAVVLAKAQATAARSEAAVLEDQLRDTEANLVSSRSESERVNDALSQVRHLNAELDKQRAMAEAANKEIRDQLAYERTQRVILAQQLDQLERERIELRASMGWMSRRRFRRR
jgi:hypothetical protein